MNIAIADALTSVVKARRTVKPGAMNAQVIPNETIETLLEMAHWAPTHAKTEPWRFFVYTGEGLQQFCLDHAEMYKNSVTNKNSDLAAFLSSSRDNPYLPPGFVQSVINSLTPEQARLYVDCIIEYAEGAVYPTILQYTCEPFEIPDHWERYVAHDPKLIWGLVG